MSGRSGPRSRARRGLVVAGVAWAAAIGAGAYIPATGEIANAVAKVNRAAGRASRLALDVELRMGVLDAVVASGTLLSDPSGTARIELRSPRGTWERHLRRGATLRATRQGELQDQPRPFLPPFFLLQADTAGVLQTRLVDMGARIARVALGFEGASDCYVIGGRGPLGGPADRPALWIDSESFEPVRIDSRPGTSFRLGPPKQFGKLRVPAWIDIHQGELFLGRLSVRRAAVVRPDPDAFSSAWLSGSP